MSGTEVKFKGVLDTEIGVTLELCARIVDKPDKDTLDIARAEVLEECGYDVPRSKVRKIMDCLGNVGSGGETIDFFYAEVTDDMKVSEGGGLEEEGESIEVVEMDIEEARTIIDKGESCTTPPTLFGILWFLSQNK